MDFFNSAVGVLQTLVIALGAASLFGARSTFGRLCNDNPGAKSQGIKRSWRAAVWL